MLKLLKGELIYNGMIISTAVVLAFLFFTTIWLWVGERNVVPNQMLILLATTFLGAYVGEGRRVEKKRDRLHALLPVKFIQIGFFRHVFPLILWVIILLIFFLTSFLLLFIKNIDPHLIQKEILYPAFNQFLILNGWILITNSGYLMLLDLRLSTPVKGQKVLYRIVEILLPFLAMLPFYLAMNFLGIFDEELNRSVFLRYSESFFMAVLFNITGIVLLIFNVKFFLNRVSYLSN